MATQNQPYRHTDGNGHRNSRDIEHDIERTRGEMDSTLDQLTERLRPQHLMDEAYAYFRASAGENFSKEELAQRAKEIGSAAVCQIRRHPVPSALIGAGLLWMLFESREEERDMHAQWADIPEYSGSFVDARTGEPYDLETYGAEWKQEVPAWRQGYDWSKSDVNEESWNERAKESLAHIRTTLGDTGKSAAEKMREISRRITGLSGHKRDEIHARWDNLREHSGSFVDARTGEPYDESYGREWHALMACDYCATGDWTAEEQESWSEKAQHALEEMQSTLADTGRGAKEQVQALAAKVGEFVGGTREMSGGLARSTGRRAAQMGRGMRRGVGRGARYVGRQARRGGVGAGRQLSQGYTATRDAVSQSMDEYPLAAGAACLGLGLLLGLALPHTRYEDRMMGEASDDLKHRAKETGREAAQRARHVAEATAAAAMDEAEEQGLTPAQLAEKAQRTADKMASKAQEKTGAGVQSMADKAGRVAERAAETAKHEARHEAEEMAGRHTSTESRPTI